MLGTGGTGILLIRIMVFHTGITGKYPITVLRFIRMIRVTR